MAAPFQVNFNRVKFSSTTSGLVNFGIGAAATGFRTPSTAAIPDGTTVAYTAQSADLTQWETGHGLYSVGTVTVTRVTIFESSNANAKVNFSAPPTVWLDLLAQDIEGWVTAIDASNPRFGDIGSAPRATIQAAIDYGWANNIMLVRIPGTRATNYVLDGPLFVDPPLNLRSGISLANQKLGVVAVPSIFNDRGMVVECDPGIIFSGSWTTSPFVWMGTQNRQKWIGGQFLGPVASGGPAPGVYARGYPILCTGIAVASGNGGAIETSIEDCDIKHFYNGISFGANGQNALAEGNRILRVKVSGCANAYKWYNGQSFPNQFIDCQGGGSYAIFGNDGQDLNVEGGEFGPAEAFASSTVFSIAALSPSALTPFTSGALPGNGKTFTNYTFTLTWDPGSDVDFFQCPDGGFVYYACVLVLPSFGLVPVQQTGYDLVTHIATYQICAEWTWMYYTDAGIALDTDTDFNTELATGTFCYSERAILSTGTINIHGAHYEKAAGVLALKDEVITGYPNNPPSVFDSVYFRSNPVGDSIAGSDRVSRSWGMIRQGISSIEFRNIPGNSFAHVGNKNGVIVGNTTWNNNNTNRMIWRGGTFNNPILRFYGMTPNAFPTTGSISYDNTLASLAFQGSKAGGFGEYDRNPFGCAITNIAAPITYYLKTAGGTSDVPMFGLKPSPSAMLRLTTADVAGILNQTTDVPVCGGKLMQISDLGTSGASLVVDKGGNFWTWTATPAFTITWTCKGASHYLNITGGAHRNYLQPGLEIILTTDVTLTYVITGIDFDGTNITGCMLHRLDNVNTNISGVKTTIYTDTTIPLRKPILSFPGQTRTARVSGSNFSVASSTTPGNVTGLTEIVSPGLTYQFSADLFTTSNSSIGIVATINSSTVTASSIIYEGTTTSSTGALGLFPTRASSFGTLVGEAVAVTAGKINVSGTLSVNSSSPIGPINMQFAQSTPSSTASFVLIGSRMAITEIP